MRRKKHKNARRAVRFFKVTSGFRPPYKVPDRSLGRVRDVPAAAKAKSVVFMSQVIVDGNFVHALTQQRYAGYAHVRELS